ncbi:MAG: hypothetical protein PVI86_14650 [Phycisphaerae bacterium]
MALSAALVFGHEPRFKLIRQTADGGGAMRSTGGDFKLSGTFAQPDAGVLTGGVFRLSGGFWFPVAPTDCDETGTVGFLDYQRMVDCVTGPAVGVSEGCECLDVDASETVDLRDVAVLQAEFNDSTGPPSEPELTTVEGYVVFLDGSPVAGAEVSIFDHASSSTTNGNGRFAILNVPASAGLIHVKAVKRVNDIVTKGAVASITPCANGITDAGVITLDSEGTDLDNDLLPDAIEPALGYNPTLTDTDGDLVIDGLEDRDGDGIPNCHELGLGTDVTKTDTDADFLSDRDEVDLGTDPLIVDTDHDGFIDGEEVEFDSDALDENDFPVDPAWTAAVAFALLPAVGNIAAPAPNVPSAAAFMPRIVAIENASPPAPNVPSHTAFGPTASVENVNGP